LKCLFDRTVPVFMGEKASGIPLPRQKGKGAVIVTACTTPWPLTGSFRRAGERSGPFGRYWAMAATKSSERW
ncbi:MAG: hypothetical protein R6X07_12680, partial [Desulfatiglandales bacterium]